MTLLVTGEYSYGHLQTERGVHRLESESRRSMQINGGTLPASVDVVPEIADTAPD